MANFNDLLPAAPAGGVNVKWQADGSANISAYYAKAEAQTPWVVDVDAQGHVLSNAAQVILKAGAAQHVRFMKTDGQIAFNLAADDNSFAVVRRDDVGAFDTPLFVNRSTGIVSLNKVTQLKTSGNIESPNDASMGHSFNLTWDGANFRYVAADSGFLIQATAGGFKVRTAPSGAVGAVATLSELLHYRSAYSLVRTDSLYLYPATAGGSVISLLATSGAALRWGMQMTADTANDFSIIRYYNDSGGADTPLNINRSTGNITVDKYLRLTTRTAAVDDAAAASAGVPVGGIYHNAGALRVRLT